MDNLGHHEPQMKRLTCMLLLVFLLAACRSGGLDSPANYDSPAGCLIHCSSQPSTSGGCLANAPTDAHTLTNTHS